MSDWLVVKVSPDCKKILDVLDAGATHGEAFRKAQQFLADGYQVRIIGQNEVQEWEYLWNRISEQREFGFISESGAVPNGNAIRRGQGARGIGRMIEYTPQEIIDNRRQELRESGSVLTVVSRPNDDVKEEELDVANVMERFKALKKLASEMG